MNTMQRPRSLSPATRARIVVRNRRMRYLEMHPQYLDDASLELAG